MVKPNPNNMNVIPVSFNSEHKELLSHLAMIVSKSYLCLPKQFDKMEIALRTTYADEYSLNKDKSSYNEPYRRSKIGMETIQTKIIFLVLA